MDDIQLNKSSLVGKAAPQFVAHSTRGMLDLSAYEGSWVLLFCHPADFTPVCTTEFISLANNQQRFDELGVELIGLSIDSVYSHLSWIDWIEQNFEQKVSFPVVEDTSMQIAKAYGMIDESSVNTSTVRACAFIDPNQTIQAVIHYPMYIGRSIGELLRVQRALIDTYQNDLSTPADWQPGDKYLKTSLDMESPKADNWLSSVINERTNG